MKILFLTDRSGHSAENALYAIARATQKHPIIDTLDVVTRSNSDNDLFFKKYQNVPLSVAPVTSGFQYDKAGTHFDPSKKRYLSDYDAVWLRLPPPLSFEFLAFLSNTFPNTPFINNPQGIWTTGSKSFLLNFPEVCPPMQLCDSAEKIDVFRQKFPIVLKPLREYGGRGIVRIDGDTVFQGEETTSFDSFTENYKNDPVEYLGVKFLKNVKKGDKRIVVVDGKIMGASLRLPAEDSWLCNVAMGGSSNPSYVEPYEEKIIEVIHPKLSEMGIVMYGVDTLVGDDGKRVLSEINTTSIGGLPQIANYMKKPLVEEAVEMIVKHLESKKT